MFASKDLPAGTIIAEEQSLIRLLGFDIQTPKGDPHHSDIVETLELQFRELELQEEEEFLKSLEPFPGTQLGEAEQALNLMQKYGINVFHPVFANCTALFRNICRVNHSCDNANTWLSTFRSYQEEYSNGRLTAQRDIKIGEEILIDYTYSAWRNEDKMEMFGKYQFHCSRDTCASCYSFLDESTEPVE